MPFMEPAYNEWQIELTDSVEVPQEWIVRPEGNEAVLELDALLYALQTLPPFYRTAAMNKMSIVKREGLYTWRIAVNYSLSRTTPISSVPGAGIDGNIEEPEIGYELGGETRHITDSLSSLMYRTGNDGEQELVTLGSEPIGVTKDEVKGCDIPFPLVNFTETHYFPAVKLRGDPGRELRSKWESLFGKVNAEAFRGYLDGEVRFEGLSLRQKGNKPVAVTFKFQRRQTLTEVPIGGFVIDEIPGWSIPDPRWEEYKNATTMKMSKRVAEVYVHEVLKSGDFTDLGISTD